MKETICLCPKSMQVLRHVNDRLMSYNIEMTEITGGTFWKAYSPEEIAGRKAFAPVKDFNEVAGLLQVYAPVDLYNPKLRSLAKALGPVWVRVSGSWATKTYYDFDGHTHGQVPKGYQSILTKEQWIGVLDFVKAVGAKLLVSVANCEGLHSAHEPWNPSQAKLLFDLSREYGVPIQAAEFMNEPNMLTTSGAPEGYTPADYVRDHDLFNSWVRENYPEVLLVGPCSTGDNENVDGKMGGGIGALTECCSTRELMQGAKVKLDIFSYHCYNGISERLASVMPELFWGADQALSKKYLGVAADCAEAASKQRDLYCPGSPMWVTESGDAGGGGCTWASTYLDVFRTLNELGSFATISDGVIFHNTLASSDYGFLAHTVFDPRPNYFAVLLWNRLMGSTVYKVDTPVPEGVYAYAHSRKDGKGGVVYLIINTSEHEAITLDLPCDAQQYTLSADCLRSTIMKLNGTPLVLSPRNELPDLKPALEPAGALELPAASCTFLVM